MATLRNVSLVPAPQGNIVWSANVNTILLDLTAMNVLHFTGTGLGQELQQLTQMNAEVWAL
jgi:hypothetical protein